MIKFSPAPGQILRCDFSQGFEPPEMVKVRPVVVISPRKERINMQTCLVVPLSTTKPEFLTKHHVTVTLPGELPKDMDASCWAKCDMIYAVGLKRLGLLWVKKVNGKRVYYTARLSPESLAQIRQAAAYAIGFHR